MIFCQKNAIMSTRFLLSPPVHELACRQYNINMTDFNDAFQHRCWCFTSSKEIGR